MRKEAHVEQEGFLLITRTMYIGSLIVRGRWNVQNATDVAVDFVIT